MSETFSFDPRFVRTCTFATLHTPGYGTRVTLANALDASSPYVSNLVVSLSAFGPDGTYLGTTEPFLELPPGAIEKVEVDCKLELLAPGGGELRDVLGVLHVVPERWVGQERVEVSRAELMAHVFATDDFVEFFSYRGHVVTGVAYQTGPVNDRRLSSTCTTTIQAPKVIVSDDVDTLFLLLNAATRLDYHDEVTLDFKIAAADGSILASSSITVPPWSFRLLSCRAVLEQTGALDAFRAQGGLGTLFGLAMDGTLVPLSMTRNDRTQAVAVDHTLPPTYYVNQWGGALRTQGNARLAAVLFAENDIVVGA